jgi:predicted Zn-dependent protease with MMP-like domain
VSLTDTIAQNVSRSDAIVSLTHPRVGLRAEEYLPVRIRSVTVDDGGTRRPAGSRPARIRRRDLRGRGMRGTLTPQEMPLYRSRAQRFDDLVLEAVAQLEPRWQAELSGVEFAVEEIPSTDAADGDPEPVPLARLDPAAGTGDPGEPARPARIVVYRRPLMARADDEDDLSELVLDVVVEEFARLLGVDPQAVDPGYPDED